MLMTPLHLGDEAVMGSERVRALFFLCFSILGPQHDVQGFPGISLQFEIDWAFVCAFDKAASDFCSSTLQSFKTRSFTDGASHT